MAASDDIQRKKRSGDSYGYPVLANIKLYQGAMVGITANKEAVPAGHASAVKLVGFAPQRVDNTGGATGDRKTNIDKGVYQIALAGATVANIGAAVYASDDNTFTLTQSTYLQAGTIYAIDADGVWLKTL